MDVCACVHARACGQQLRNTLTQHAHLTVLRGSEGPLDAVFFTCLAALEAPPFTVCCAFWPRLLPILSTVPFCASRC